MRTQAEEERDWRRTLELPAEIKAPLTALAARRERSVSAEIRVALREHVERHGWERWLEREDA
jgi:predicted transcriptional regulator